MLRPYQKTDLLKLWKDFYKYKVHIIQEPTGCHIAGTKILMYDGSEKNVEEIKVNDLLMGVDGTERKVLTLHSGVEQLYKIKINKCNKELIVNENHILYLKNTIKSEFIEISVKDYLIKSNNFKHLYKIVFSDAIEFEENNHIIPPYLLGLLIGDGGLSQNSIYLTLNNKKVEIIAYIKDWCLKNNYSLTIVDEKEKFTTFRFGYFFKHNSPLLKEIKRLGLNTTSKNKFIPQEYLIDSIKNRQELLAGLIDTDGYKSKNYIEYTTSSKKLSDNLNYLCGTIGIRINTSIKKVHKYLNNDYYRSSIFGSNLTKIPIKYTDRRIEPTQNKNALVSGFNIEPYKIGNYYGFEVDKDNLFIVSDNYTINHNSGKSVIMTTGLKLLLRRIEKNANILIVSPRLEINSQLEYYLIKLNIIQHCSIITNLNRKILKNIEKYDYIITDECHNFQASTFKNIWKKANSDCKLIGFTATPMCEKLNRIDNKICGLWSHFLKDGVEKKDINYIQGLYQTKDLINQGYLSKFKMIPCYKVVENVIKKARRIKSAMQREQSFTQIVGMIPKYKILQALENSKSAIAFCSSIQYCIDLKEYLKEQGINAELLVSELDEVDIKQDRKQIVNDFKSGKIRLLLTVNIANEGFDCPLVDTALMLRPTNSLRIYLQQAGRVLRIHPDKPITYIYDFVGNGAYFGSIDEYRDWKSEFWLEKDPKEKPLLDTIPIKECPVCLNIMSGNAVRECPYCHFDFYKWHTVLGKEIYLTELWKKYQDNKNKAKQNELLLTEKMFIKQTRNDKGLMLHLQAKDINFYWCFYNTNKFMHQAMLKQINEICNFQHPSHGLNENILFYKCKNKIIDYKKENEFNKITSVRDLSI